MKRNKFNPAKAKRSLDRMYSQFILTRDNRTCQRCGATNCKIDTMHLLPREILSVRWSELNGFGGCIRCHKYGNQSWHKNPIASVDWLISKVGRGYIDNLLTISKKPFTFDEQTYNQILDRLTK
jgi:hypothetical protein